MAQQKPVGKTATKPKLGGEIGRPPFDKKSPVTYLPGRKATNVPKSKNGKSFPDLNKDGKVTRADILKGRGVIAKKGATIEKAQLGKLIKKGVKRVGNEVRAIKKGVEEGRKAYTDSKWRAQLRDPSRPFPKMVDGPGFDGRPFPKRKQPNHKTGGTVSNTKKCKYGCK